MRRQLRLDALFVLVLVAAAVMLMLVFVQKSADCAAHGGSLVVIGRDVFCRLIDGAVIPF